MSNARMQLLGCACLSLAAKYEEQFAPGVDEFVMITDSHYSREDILAMEMEVLVVLEWRLTVCTPKAFLRRFQRVSLTTSVEKHLSNYLGELAMLSYELVACPPDQVAAAAVFLSRLTLYASDSPNRDLGVQSNCFRDDRDVWTPDLRHFTGFTAENLAQVIRKLHVLHHQVFHRQLNTTQPERPERPGAQPASRRQPSVYDKYRVTAYEQVARVVRPYALAGPLLPTMGETTFYLADGG
jgi:hypothetical protein